MKNGQRSAGSGERRKPLFYWIIALSLLSVVAHPPPLTATTPADLAWEHRDQQGQTEKAIELWAQEFKANPGRTELLIRLTQASGRAYRHATSKEKRRYWADTARSFGERAVAQNPGSAAAFTEYGAALGQWAESRRSVGSLKVVKQAVEMLNKAIAMDPNNFFAHMLLAEFYRETPRTISIGDKDKALKQARLAVQTGPAYAIAHLSLAKCLLALDQKEEAIQELQKVLSLPVPAGWGPETRSDKETAQKLLTKLGANTQSSSSSLPTVTGACSSSPAGDSTQCGQ